MNTDRFLKVNRLNKFKGVCHFLWSERRSFLLVAALFWLLSLLVFASSAKDKVAVLLEWETWDKVVTLFTLLVGIAVFLGEAVEDWEERLTKRLTVFFQVHGKTCMVCYGAHLPHEGDIRNWGQQIGRQMCEEPLEFSPYLDIRRLGVESDGVESFTHFQAIIYLKKIPDGKNFLPDKVKANTIPLAKKLETHSSKHDGVPFCKVLRADKEGGSEPAAVLIEHGQTGGTRRGDESEKPGSEEDVFEPASHHVPRS